MRQMRNTPIILLKKNNAFTWNWSLPLDPIGKKRCMSVDTEHKMSVNITDDVYLKG